MIYLLLADDHPIMRQGLRGVFANEPDLTLVGEAGTGLEAIRLAEKLQPHVLVPASATSTLGMQWHVHVPATVPFTIDFQAILVGFTGTGLHLGSTDGVELVGQ